MHKKMTARQICEAAGLSLSQRQTAKNAGIDVTDLEAMKRYRKTLNKYAVSRKKPTAAPPPEPPGKPMSMEEIEAALRRPDLDPNEARTLKLRVEALQRLMQYKQQAGELISLADLTQQHTACACACQVMLRKLEKNLPQLLLGLPLSSSLQATKQYVRELQTRLSQMDPEFWKHLPKDENA